MKSIRKAAEKWLRKFEKEPRGRTSYDSYLAGAREQGRQDRELIALLKKIISLSGDVPCPICEGTGLRIDGPPMKMLGGRVCPDCKGSGQWKGRKP